jgi:hypothetical protein
LGRDWERERGELIWERSACVYSKEGYESGGVLVHVRKEGKEEEKVEESGDRESMREGGRCTLPLGSGFRWYMEGRDDSFRTKLVKWRWYECLYHN